MLPLSALSLAAALVAVPDGAATSAPEPISSLNLALGPSALLDAPGGQSRMALGQSVRVQLGLHLGERLAGELALAASANRLGAGYTGPSPGRAQGDLTALMPTASLRLNLIGTTDSRALRRWWVFLRAGAGYALFWPRALIGAGDAVVLGSLGVDYRSHLHGLRIGVELTPAYFPRLSFWSASLTPTVEVAF
jgi:hypothetical protein